MFSRTERLYLLYAETQGFISPEQASSAEAALRSARESGQEFPPWELLREWQYLSPEQTTALYNAVERAVDKCERHPLVVSGSPTAETTQYPAVGEPFDVPAEPHPETLAVPSLPPTPAEGTPAILTTELEEPPEPDTVSPIFHDTPTPLFHYVTPPAIKPEVNQPLDIPALTPSPDGKQKSTEPETKPSLTIPSLVPQEEKQEESDPRPDPGQKKKTKVRIKNKTNTKVRKRGGAKPNSVASTVDKTVPTPAALEEPPATPEQIPTVETAPATDDSTAGKIKAEEAEGEEFTKAEDTESSETRETSAAPATTEPGATLAGSPDKMADTKSGEKQSKTSKPETKITVRSRTRAAEARSKGISTAVAAAIAAIVVLGGGAYFVVMNSNEVKLQRLKMAKAINPPKRMAEKEGIDAIFGAKKTRAPIGGQAEVTTVQTAATNNGNNKQEATKAVDNKQQTAVAAATEQQVQANQQRQQQPNQAGDSTKPAQQPPAENAAQLIKEMNDLADFLGQEDSIWLGNETFKGKHDGEKNIFNIYTGSPVPEDGRIKVAGIFTNAPEGTVGSLFLLRKQGDKLKVIEHEKFFSDQKFKDYVTVKGLNWIVKKGDLLAHWGIAPARKEADTADECYVLEKEPAKDEEISLAGNKKLPRRLYAMRAEFVVPEKKEQEKK
ncbi:MAG: hypothetical protein O2857_08845 [Planctomycetota bacterium]|nr:hypothetical protein [Planctomycetota bacterium]